MTPRLATLVVLIVVALAALAINATLSAPVVNPSTTLRAQPLTEWAMPVVASGTPTIAATGGWFSTLYPTETVTAVPGATANTKDER